MPCAATESVVCATRWPIRWACPPTRSLGLILAGDDGRGTRAARTYGLALAFGHNGAGGQLAWADPATGVSLGYVTDGGTIATRSASRGEARAISSIAAERVVDR